MLDSLLPPDTLEPLMGFLAWAFSFLCHQDPDSLVRVGGMTLPLCWRCAGLHIGCAAAWFILLRPGNVRRQAASIPVSALLWASFLTLFLHWMAGQLSLFPMTPVARYATGLWAGAGVGFLLASGIRPQRAASGANLVLTYVFAATAGAVLFLLDRWTVVLLGVFVSIVLNVFGALTSLVRILPPSTMRMLKGAPS